MFDHPRRSRWQRARLFLTELGRMGRTAFTGPCGHECNGDERSWYCPTCGSSGSSS